MKDRETIQQVLSLSCFEPIDRHFARLVVRLAGDGADAPLAVAALLASSRTAHGDICARLAESAGRQLGEVLAGYTGEEQPACPAMTLPRLDGWRKSLLGSGLVKGPGEAGHARAPLVLDDEGNLFMYRYWQYEMVISRWIDRRVGADGEILHSLLERVHMDVLRDGLNRLFAADEGFNWQRLAAASGVLRPFTVLTGGPGTGKTTTVIKMLAVIIEQYLAGNTIPSIALAAPTGKAAGRMKETIKQQRLQIECDQAVLDHIPEETFTLHRLLGTIHGRSHFRHNEDNPLPFDVVIVDESSMVDVALMARLVQAMPEKGRLILLGDRDQLSSVEAGAVLGDICDSGQYHGYTGKWNDVLQGVSTELPAEKIDDAEPPMADTVVMLQKNYRFGTGSGIGELSRSIREGDERTVLSLLESDQYGDISIIQPAQSNQVLAVLPQLVTEGYGAFTQVNSPEEAFSKFAEFTILTPFRTGPFGIHSLNHVVEKILHGKGQISVHTPWYNHRPVMITVNDYSLRLYNGDVGIVLPEDVPHQHEDTAKRVWFQEPGGSFRSLSPSRLHATQTSYAMTVHKSQGSEFDHVLLVLPPSVTDTSSRLLTRELLYTAVTRARSRVTILGSTEVVSYMAANPTSRASGLRNLLWSVR